MLNQILTPQAVRDLQSIVPAWMEKILSQAEAQGKTVFVTRMITPFGYYTTNVEINSEEGNQS